MPPKTNTPAPTPAPAPAGSTTIGGHAVQILAFIPDNKADMRGQARLLELLADLKDGTKTIVDLADHLKAVEVKANYTRRRFTPEEAAALYAVPTAETKAPEPTTAEEAITRLTEGGAANPEDEARLTWPDLFPAD